MMYKVKARVIEEKLDDYFKLLASGKVEKMGVDGPYIVNAMKEAKITAPGIIEWYELCYCPTPLKHERSIVYDEFLTDLTTEPVEKVGKIEGEVFWETAVGLTDRVFRIRLAGVELLKRLATYFKLK